jgi:Rgg/GadR/MutR family transcriptional activator
MLEEYGKAMRDLREDRGFSLRMVAEGIINPATLAKFERGETALSFENLFPLLSRLNVTVGEFIYQANSFDRNAKVSFFNDVTNAYFRDDITALESMAAKAASKIEETPSRLPYDRINLITIRSAIASLQNTKLSHSDSSFASDYFLSLSNLFYYDLLALRFICDFFNASDTLRLSTSLFSMTRIYSKVGNSAQYVEEIALSVVERLIATGKLSDARRIIVLYRREQIISDSVTALLDLKELGAAIDYIEGRTSEANTIFKQVIATLRWLSLDQIAKQQIVQWNRLTKTQ